MAFDEFGFDDAEEGGFGLDGEVEEGGAGFLLIEVGEGAVDVFHGGVFGGSLPPQPRSSLLAAESVEPPTPDAVWLNWLVLSIR